MQIDESTIERLADAARRARSRAHAPYSGFVVGAALLDETGRIVAGCNVENAVYGLGICAERAALFTGIAEGFGRPIAVLVVGGESQPVTPCGACRQVMVELCDRDADVILVSASGVREITSVDRLLPEPFTARVLGPTPDRT